LVEALAWHLEEEAEVAIGDSPVNRMRQPAPAANLPDMPQQEAPREVAAQAVRPAPSIPKGGFSIQQQDAVLAAKACTTLEQLQAAIRAYDGLEVKRTATNMVFADGNPAARVMIIGEAPGGDEDRQGLPFVGVSGQLLDKMFDCINLSRKSDQASSALYISNILNWRPPGNRTPTEQEIALALPFVERHIALIRPQYIVVAGATAAKSILNMNQPISKLRGRFYDYTFVTSGITEGLEPMTARVLPTYHPSFLLRTPAQKRQAWHDLLTLQAELTRN